MAARKKPGWLRHPRTTQERRWAIEGWCRPRRNVVNLINAWDDNPVPVYKSWKHKTKRKKQYRPKDLP